MNQYDKNGLYIVDGEIKSINNILSAKGRIIIPPGVKSISIGASIYANSITTATIEYNNFDDLISLIKSAGFRKIIGFGKLNLTGPKLTTSEKKIIDDYLNDYGTKYQIDYVETHSDTFLNEIVPNEYSIIDSVLTNYDYSKPKMIIPNGVIKIDLNGLDYYDMHEMEEYNVEEIVLPNTVTEISDNAFSSFWKLDSVVLSKNLKSIGRLAFGHCSKLKNIKLYEGLKYIGSLAFSDCNSLENIYIPSTIEELDSGIFNRCNNLKLITIRYKSFEKLIDLINNSAFFRDYEIPDIEFEGPSLTLSERISVKKTIKNKQLVFEGKRFNNRITFVDNNDIEKIENEEKGEPTFKYESDIQAIIDKINLLCKYLPDGTKNNIFKMVDELLITYKNDLDNLKPKYGKSDSNILEFGTVKNIKSLKPILLADLERIVTSISSINSLIKFLENLQKYKVLLNTSVDSISSDNSIDSNISDILYMVKSFSNDDQQKYTELLAGYIDDAINKASNEVSRYLGNNPRLLIVEDYKLQFEVNVSKLYDEVSHKYEKVKPFKELFDALNSINIKPELIDDNSIKDFINSTYYVISNISDGKYKEELLKQFNDITSKYYSMVSNIINNDEELQKIIYEDIEQSLRSDFQSLLEMVKKYAYLDKYVSNKANKMNIINQLLTSIDIVKSQKMYKPDVELPIINFVIEINNKVISNNVIDEKTRKQIYYDLLNKLNECVVDLKERNIDTLEEYNQVVLDIMKVLAGVNIDVSVYIQNVEEYNSYIKTS